MNRQRIIKILRPLILSTLIAFALNARANAESDPYTRVVRLNYVDGKVTFSPSGSDEWVYAYINRPLTSGDQLWTDTQSRAEMHNGSTALRINSQTNFKVLALDDTTTQFQLTQGTLSFHVRTLAKDQFFEIDTPNFAFQVNRPGQYRIDVDPDHNISTVLIREGSGIVSGQDNNSYTLNSGQKFTFAESNLRLINAEYDTPDDNFDTWVAARNRREDKSTSSRYISREITGYEDLDAYGTWRQDPTYGDVWVPTIRATDWVPYSNGHWAWVAPWGWTWIDDAPWGFAPSHYGRWARINSSWGWVPGAQNTAPAYAPALVAFISTPSSESKDIAWFPLAPGEAYRPAYHATPHYLNLVNNRVTINQVQINTNITQVYINQQAPHAITAVPVNSFVKGHSVQQASIRVPSHYDHPSAKQMVVVGAPLALAPTQQSFTGHSAPATMPPARTHFNRPIIATRMVTQPSALHLHDIQLEKTGQQPHAITSEKTHLVHASSPLIVVVERGHAKSAPTPALPAPSHLSSPATATQHPQEKPTFFPAEEKEKLPHPIPNTAHEPFNRNPPQDMPHPSQHDHGIPPKMTHDHPKEPHEHLRVETHSQEPLSIPPHHDHSRHLEQESAAHPAQVQERNEHNRHEDPEPKHAITPAKPESKHPAENVPHPESKAHHEAPQAQPKPQHPEETLHKVPPAHRPEVVAPDEHHKEPIHEHHKDDKEPHEHEKP